MPGTLQMEGVQLRIDFSFASVAPGQIPPISYATQKLLRVDNNTGFTRLLPHATCADHYIKSGVYKCKPVRVISLRPPFNPDALKKQGWIYPFRDIPFFTDRIELGAKGLGRSVFLEWDLQKPFVSILF